MKINTSSITGFGAMDADALRKFISEYDYDDGSAEIRRLKESIDKLTGENAEVKRKYHDALSAEERAAEERKEREKEKDDLIAALTREKALNDFRARYTAIGYTAEQATAAAEALLDGKTDALFDLQKAHLEAQAKNIRIDNMKSTPQPPAGNGGAMNAYQQELEQAMQENNMANAAYLIRLQQEGAAENR